MSHSPSTLSSSSTSSSISTRIDVTFADKEILDITQKIDDMKSTIASLKEERRQLWSLFECLTPRPFLFLTLPTLEARIFAAKELLFSFVMSPSSAVWADQETAFQALHVAQARLCELETQLLAVGQNKAQLPEVQRSPIGTLPSGSGDWTPSQTVKDIGGESQLRNVKAHLPAVSSTPDSPDPSGLPTSVAENSANPETPKTSRKTKVACSYPGCGVRVSDMYQHTRFKHGGAKKLTCDRCGWQTVYPHNFRAHQLQGSKVCRRRQLEQTPKAISKNIATMDVS